MKILAYGGNQYSIRARIGEWPEALMASVADLYGLPPEQPSFGVVFPGDAPCLLYRERMSAEMRGGYPYTILLDLGTAGGETAAWAAAQSNAAALLYFLFRAQSPWRAALLTPESLNPNAVEKMLDEMVEQRLLEEFRGRTGGGEPSAWAKLVTGSLVADELTVATPAALGLTGRPTMREVAEWVAQMPPMTRTGNGWMVGGSSTQAGAFGAALLVDDQPYGAAANPTAAMEAGARLLALLNEANRSGATTPEAGEGLTPRGSSMFFRRLLLLDRVRNGGEDAYREPLPSSGPLHIEIFDTAVRSAEAMARRGESIGPLQSRAVLDGAQARDAQVTEEVFRHLDADVLRAWFDARSIPPEPIADGFDVPGEMLLERCLARIQTEGLTPETLEKYRRYLRENRAERAEDELLQQAVPRLPSPLTAWARRGDTKLGKRLTAEAERRFRERQGKSWLADAVHLVGAKWAAEQVESLREDLDLPVRGLVDEKPLSEEAGTFLELLAGSAARARLGTMLKVDIAGKVHEGWESLWLLGESLQGRGQFPGGRLKDDREVLASECMDLLENYARLGKLQAAKGEFSQIAKKLRLAEGYAERLKKLAEQYPSFGRLAGTSASGDTQQLPLQIQRTDSRRSPRDVPEKPVRMRAEAEAEESARGMSRGGRTAPDLERIPPETGTLSAEARRGARARASAEPWPETSDPYPQRNRVHFGLEESAASEEAAEDEGGAEEKAGALNALRQAVAIHRSIAELIEAVERGQVRFTATNARERDAEWDALVDLLRFTKLAEVRGKARAPEDYGPRDSHVPLAVTVFFLVAGALIACLAAAGSFTSPIHGISTAMLIGGCFLAGGIFFAASRMLTARYVLNIPGDQYDRLISLLDRLMVQRNGYATSREKQLLRRLAESDRPLQGLGSFDRALLLYLGNHRESVERFAGDRVETFRRIRRGIYRSLAAEHMIRNKGWLQ